ncbi:helicase C-terminal domain-containing protein [Ramlibacter sp.]|uniref:ATP-dependent DNA helicase n=1 Tax=Ramlibacter sp. TaxID=1917967 RepID=UPI003D148DAC
MPYSVAVRALCEFTARRGDLDLRFTPGPSAQDGTAGHRLVASRRGPDYETEVTLRGEFDELAVRGRADGYDAAANRVEEIKTHRGDLARQPANHRHLHWAQAKVYAWLLCQARELSEIDVALVYFDIDSEKETVFTERHSAEALRQFFEDRCREFLDWARQELAHRDARDASLASLAFPHAGFRTGQRELAEAVYKGVASGRCLLAQAPTGIGKTVGTLFAMLKGAKPHALDKIFYLTAKSTGRRMALDAARLIRDSDASVRLRVLELTARDKACVHPDKACHGDSCPLARGFHDRLPAARAQAVALEASLDQAAIASVAATHDVCPYYLAQELTRWSDLVVGDYNYWFDGSAMLHAFALEGEWRVGVLADEAHNLVERARTMYSASMGQAAVRRVKRNAPAALRPALDRFQRSWSVLRKAHEQAEGELDALPQRFVDALRQACAAMESHFAQEPSAASPGELQAAYFDMLAFARLAETFGTHSVLEWSDAPDDTGKPAALVRIQNQIPAPFLKPRFAAARSATLFSATLSPPQYQIDMLGLPDGTAWLDVESPFSSRQLQVRVVSRISTRYHHRSRSVAPIASLMAEQFEQQPGNYLAFFSSFDYLDMAAAEFEQRFADIPAWKQSRGMDERRRREFVDRFAEGGRGVGFAVLGGSFGEGIDLRGDRLIGAFVATLGLPQVNPRNEQLSARLESVFGRGYDYAYLYPGLQKVVQAAGRVIRTQEDRGVVYLIDDRFSRPAVRELLPAWWGLGSARGS